MFELVEAHLQKIGKKGLLPAGIIITGGGSRVTTIEDIAKTPIEHLEKIAGKWGEALWHKAHGIGSTEITTDWDTENLNVRVFDVVDTEPYYWHCVYSECNRYSFGFRLFKK